MSQETSPLRALQEGLVSFANAARLSHFRDVKMVLEVDPHTFNYLTSRLLKTALLFEDKVPPYHSIRMTLPGDLSVEIRCLSRG